MPPGSIAALLEAAATSLAASSDSPRLDAEALLAFALGRPRSYLRARPEKPPDAASGKTFANLVARRAAGTPVAYLTGIREFFSLTLEVGPAVLIPRPETELLVELALGSIRPDSRWTILDAGTGSGAIALAIAKERPRCRIVASDNSRAALAVAQRNAGRLGIGNVDFVAGDWLAPFPEQSFELIVSNPPYVADTDPHLEQGDVRAEPRAALAGGVDGLDAIRSIARQAHGCLRPGGTLILEHGYDQGEAVADILQRSAFRNLEAARDLAGQARAARGQT